MHGASNLYEPIYVAINIGSHSHICGRHIVLIHQKKKKMSKRKLDMKKSYHPIDCQNEVASDFTK